MMPPVLTHSDFLYTRMKGLTWTRNGIQASSMVQKDAGNVLADLYANHEVNKPLLVNFQGIKSVSGFALKDTVSPNAHTSRALIIFNCIRLRNRLIEEFANLGMPKVDFPEDDCIVWCKSEDHESVKNYIEMAKKEELKHIYSLVQNCYTSWDEKKRLNSTPLLANGAFDARKIISNPMSFLWLTLHLTEMLDSELERLENKEENKEENEESEKIPSNLLAVSLRGSPIAAAVGLLSSRDLEIEIVDHIGPKHQILEEYSIEQESRGIKYVYIGDFLIGGTEIKTAQLYARSKGNSITHAMVIGNWLNSEDYIENLEVQLLSPVKLRECRPDATVQFSPSE